MSDTATRSRTVTVLAELIHEQSTRPWERSARLAEDLFDASDRAEQTLLRTLAADPARVLTKAQLISGAVRDTRALDSSAARLRRRIMDATGARLVCNVWGVGYRLVDAAAAEV